jgi:eukaryotic-like serine/threonine-protein kinase
MIQAVLGERYRLGERIVGGGMGSVYRAVDENLGRQVAVKVLRRELADDPTFPEAFAIGEQVARALAAAHAHGLVHRDVKPANVLLGPGGAKVTDFGIAKAATSATLTRTGMVLGSANYVAPEQAQGDDVGPAADQYPLGCVLFEAVTGRTPYAGANPVAIATQHVSSPVPDPRSDLPDLPAPAADLIRRALAKHPADRFPSTSTLADALAAAGALDPPDPPGPAPHPPGPGPSPPVGERSPSERGAPAVVHSHAVHSPAVHSHAVHSPAVHTPGRPARRADRARWPVVAVGTLVVIALVLLAWLPRGEPSDPPAGQSERPSPASPTTVDNGDEDD